MRGTRGALEGYSSGTLVKAWSRRLGVGTEARAKGCVHSQVAHDEPMDHARLERGLIGARAARRDPNLIHQLGVHDCAGVCG